MQTLELEYEDSRIIWGPSTSQWVERNMTDANGEAVTVRASDSETGKMLLFFRGTGIKLYAGGTGERGIWGSFDEGPSEFIAAPTRPGSAPMLQRTALEDKDHQLFFTSYDPCWIERIELESSTGQGFDLVNHTVNAASVPKQAVLVEDFSERIELEPSRNWEHYPEELYSGGSLLRTNVAGSSFTYQFEGVAIWMFSDWDRFHGERTITLDDGPEEVVSTRLDYGHVSQRLTWSKTGLTKDVNHTLKVEYRGPEPAYVTLDFFRVLRSQDADALGEVTGTGTGTESSKGPSVPVLVAAIIIPIVVLALAGLVVFLLWRRRKNRKTHTASEIDPHAHHASQITPYQISTTHPASSPPDNRGEGYEAERPSMEEPRGKQLLTVDTSMRSPVPSYQALSTIDDSFSTTKLSSSEPGSAEPERPGKGSW